jgi:hypothetical protein
LWGGIKGGGRVGVSLGVMPVGNSQS